MSIPVDSPVVDSGEPVHEPEPGRDEARILVAARPCDVTIGVRHRHDREHRLHRRRAGLLDGEELVDRRVADAREAEDAVRERLRRRPLDERRAVLSTTTIAYPLEGKTVLPSATPAPDFRYGVCTRIVRHGQPLFGTYSSASRRTPSDIAIRTSETTVYAVVADRLAVASRVDTSTVVASTGTRMRRVLLVMVGAGILESACKRGESRRVVISRRAARYFGPRRSHG